MFTVTNARALTTTDLAKFAPAVFNTTPAERCSEKYSLFSTADIIDGLREQGYVPTWASAARRANAINGKHLVRFARTEDLGKLNPGEERPEIVLVNSHNGTSSYRLMAGVFRFVCSNGMVVQSVNAGAIRVRHQGHTLEDVITSSLEIGNNFEETWENIKEMKSIHLSESEAVKFAKAAAGVRFGEKAVEAGRILTPEALLTRQRNEDAPLTLWNVFNTVQENSIRGGVRVGRRQMRQIRNVDANVRINAGLWELADQYRLNAVAA